MTALTTFVALSPQHNNDRWYLLLVASCRVIVHNKSSVPIPCSHYSCKQNAQQACSYCQTTLFSTFPSFSRPTHPPPYVYVYVSSYVLPPLFFSFTFSFFFSIASFVLSFSSCLPLLLFSWPLRLTTTCITLHYNSSTVCRTERKTTHTCFPLSLPL